MLPGPTAPDIIEATVETSGEIQIYRCVVTGNPTPNITWMAEDERNDHMITTLIDGLDGINIESIVGELDQEVSSELTISESSPFLMPSCLARNGIGTDQEDEFTGTILYFCYLCSLCPPK